MKLSSLLGALVLYAAFVAETAAQNKYRVIVTDTTVTYSQARTLCANVNRELPTLRTASDLQDIKRFTGYGNVWVNMRQDANSRFRWADGTLFGLNGQWYSGEPNNMDTEKCARIALENGAYKFRTTNCGVNAARVVCGPIIEAGKYQIVQGGSKVTYSQAKTLCENQGRNLPTLKTLGDLNEIYLYTSLSDLWIDMVQDANNRYRWSDGTLFGLDGQWFTGEPNNLDTEKCARVVLVPGYKFRTTPCGGNYGYVVCGPKAAAVAVAEPAPSSTPTFFTVGKSLNLVDAKAECERNDAKLPEPRTQDAQNLLSSFQKSKGIGFAWVNLYYLSGRDFYWLSNKDELKYPGTAYNGWGIVYSSTDQEPNLMNALDPTRRERGVVSDAANNKWRTRKEAGTYPVICQRGGVDVAEPALTVPTVTAAVPCGSNGWFRFQDKYCIKVCRETKPWQEALAECFRQGARLFRPDYMSASLGALNNIEGGDALKGHRFFVGGSKCLSTNVLFGSSLTTGLQYEKNLLTTVATKFGTDLSNLALRWSGRVDPETLQRDNGQCMEVDFQGTSPVVRASPCTQLNQFVCQRDYDWTPQEVSQTGWFSLKAGSSAADYESFNNYRQYIIDRGLTGKVTCERPIGCQCRRRGSSTIMDSRVGQNNQNANFAAGYACQVSGSDCRMWCKEGNGLSCGDFEMNVICPRSTVNNCDLQSIRDLCKNQGRTCVNTDTGYRCVTLDTGSIYSGTCADTSGGSVSTRRCSATGDPHFVTFDGWKYNFQGACCYILAELCDTSGGLDEFQVIVCNDRKDDPSSKVTWVRSVKFFYKAKSYYFDREVFRIDGVRQAASVTGAVSVKMCQTRRGMAYTLTAGCLTLKWDGRQNVHLDISEAYANKVCGLCGNMNGNMNDEYAKSGSGALTTDVIEFANSYLFDSADHVMQECGAVVLEPPCTDDVRNRYKVDQYCGLYNPANTNSAIVRLLNPATNDDNKRYLETKFESCVVDHCENDGRTPYFIKTEITCPTADGVEEELLDRLGRVPTEDWKAGLACPQTCDDPNSEFSSTKSACENSCLDKTAEDNCAAVTNTRGCVCKANYIRDITGVCVHMDDCDNNCYSVKRVENDPSSESINIPNGGEVLLDPCKLKVTCTNGNAAYVPLTECDVNAACINDKCVCRAGYSGDGYNCESTSKGCRSGWTEKGRKCYKIISNPLPWDDAARSCCDALAQMARVDNQDEDDALNAFLLANAAAGDELWVAGKTILVGADERVTALPTSYDKSSFKDVADQDTRLGCYKTNQNGIQSIDTNCKTLRKAICEYANPDREEDAATPEIVQEIEFFLLNSKANYWGAKTQCKEAGGMLPEPRTLDLQNKLTKFQKARGLAFIRVGMEYKTGTAKDFLWNSGGTLLFSSTAFNRWGLTYSSGVVEPNAMNAVSTDRERSVVNDAGNNKWRTRKMADYYPVVCQRTTARSSAGPKYVVASTVKTTFANAVALCRGQGRDLPLTKTAEDVLELAEFTGLRLTDVWVNLEDKQGTNNWRWSDGSGFSFPSSFWYTGEPNYIGTERCGRLDVAGSAYRFRSSPCEKDWAMVVCGPATKDLPYVWSPYIETSPTVSKSVAQILQEELAKTDGVRFACRDAMAVDCEMKNADGDFVSARTINSKVICTTDAIKCDIDNCDNFRVRFFCPNEQNMCAAIQELKGSNPCPGGQQCIPELNGCFSCQCPPGYTMGVDGFCAKPCGHCYVQGDPHYVMFNGDLFDFQGVCTYRINGICEDAVSSLQPGVLRYTVDVNNIQCNPDREGVSCLKVIIISLFNVPTGSGDKKDFVIKRDRFTNYYTVDGEQQTGPFTVADQNGQEQFTARLTDRTFVFSGLGGLLITAENSKMKLTPPSGLRDEMCGLCGQCAPEAKFGDGTVRTLIKGSKKILSSEAIEFGSSWLVADDTLTAEECKVEPLPDPDPTREEEARQKCSVITEAEGPFKPCFSIPDIDFNDEYDNCVFDGSRDDAKDICETLKMVADQCTSKGVPVDWRTAERCPLDCSDAENKVYKPNVMCQKQCGDLVAPSCTNVEASDGCGCKTGFFQMGTRCLSESDCGCQTEYSVGTTITMEPNEERLSRDCKNTLKCIPGSGVFSYARTRDPNAICVKDNPSREMCATGYEMTASGDCVRNPKECDETRGYSLVGGLCLKENTEPKIYRRAIERCNVLNGTLERVDVFQKLDDLKELMERENIDSAFIAGLVRFFSDGSSEPVLTETQRGLVEYKNYDITDFALDNIQPPSIDLTDLTAEGAIFAVAAVLEAGEISIVAVPRDQKLSFICEEREDDPDDFEFTPYCSGDSPSTFSSEVERVSILMQNPNCKMCPNPGMVQCRTLDDTSLVFSSVSPNNAPDTVSTANCVYNSGVLYYCAVTGTCDDVEVSANCPKDVQECDEGLDDCSGDQTCRNINGAYLCLCPTGKPLMVDNECKAESVCTMQGTNGPDNYDLNLWTFNSGGYAPFDQRCLMNYGYVCDAPTLQFFRVQVNNRKVDNVMEQDVIVYVRKPGGSDSEQTKFEFPQDLRAVGKFKMNDQNRLGAAIKDSLTGIAVTPLGSDGSYLLAEENNRFKILIVPRADGSLQNLKLSISDDYNNKICGMCKMAGADRYTLEDSPEKEEVPAGSTACAPVIAVPPPPGGDGSDPGGPLFVTTTAIPAPPVPTTQAPPPQAQETTLAPILTPPAPGPTGDAPPPPGGNPTTGTLAPPDPTTTEEGSGGAGGPTTIGPDVPVLPTEEVGAPPPAGSPPSTTALVPPPPPPPEDTNAPPPPAGNPPTTEAPPPPPSPPTPPPPTDPCQQQIDFCNTMQSYCNIEVADCVEQTCDNAVAPCDYLATTTFFDCQKAGQTELTAFVKDNCEKECGPNQVLLLWPVSEGQPTCRDQDFDPLSESVAQDLSFRCMCDTDRGYYFENNQCVPRSECGCSLANGDYRPRGDTWSADDCSEDYECVDGDVVVTPRTCDENSACVQTENGPVCQCTGDDMGRGVPTMPNGCTPMPNGNQTCYLMGTDDEVCYCNTGYLPTCDGCQDINECALIEGLCNGRRERCENNAGGFDCVCQDGFKRNVDGKCVDINECMTLDQPCASLGDGARCVNFIGKYSCACCAGYDLVNGVCERNYTRVPTLPENPNCCPCPGSLAECIDPSIGPINGCYEYEEGKFQDYEKFRYLYEEYCLENKPVLASNWEYGDCPEEPEIVEPELPTDGPGDPQTAPPAQTSPPTRECTPSNTCTKVPTPPNLVGTEVCGPSGPNEQTYDSYCNMLIAMCTAAGGPDNFNPPSSPSATPGPCPTTTTTTTTPAPKTTLAPLNFSPWSPWGPCVLNTAADREAGCGSGKRYRYRTVLDENPPRQALASELEETYPCTIPCPETTAAPATTTTPSLSNPQCPDFEECRDTQKICGQLGTEDPVTYDSECTMEVIACNSGLPSKKLYNGECLPEDENPRRYCDDTLTKTLVTRYKPGRSDCKAEVLIGVCSDRLCRDSNTDSCCIADPDFIEEIDAIFICLDGTTYPVKIESPTQCKCVAK